MSYYRYRILREMTKSIANNVIARVNKGICPRCGHKLIKKSDGSSEYLQCINYPRCNFIYKKNSVK